jgi:hypothetical protein
MARAFAQKRAHRAAAIAGRFRFSQKSRLHRALFAVVGVVQYPFSILAEK